VKVAEESEADIDSERITARRIGRTLGKLRLQDFRKGGAGTRYWQLKVNELVRLATSYSVSLPVNLTQFINVTNVTNVTNGSPESEPAASRDAPAVRDIPATSEVQAARPARPPMHRNHQHDRFYRRASHAAGYWVCAVCHPPQEGETVEWWR